MDKQEAQKELEKLEGLEKELESLKLRKAELLSIVNKIELTPEQRFLDLMDGLTIRIDKNKTDSILYFRGNTWMVEIKNEMVRFNLENFWGVFETEFKMDYHEVKSFTQAMLEKHFKMNGVTTHFYLHSFNIWLEKPNQSKSNWLVKIVNKFL